MVRRRASARWALRGTAAVALGAATTLLIAWPVTVVALHLGWTKELLVAYPGKAYAKAGDEHRYKAQVSRGVLIDRYQLVKPRSRDSVLPLGDPKPVPGWVLTPEDAPEDLRVSVNFGDTWATGLPWRCMTGETWFVWVRNDNGVIATAAEVERPPGSGITTKPVMRDGWTIAHNASGATVVPLRVVWGGMAADVAVFSAAWGLLLGAVVWGRAARRRSRGLCGGCGYDRRGLSAGAACPECGAGGMAA